MKNEMRQRKSSAIRRVLITGGAGFIGSNLAASFLKSGGIEVRIFDNLSRDGVDRNLAWLEGLANGNDFEATIGDVRDGDAVLRAAKDATEIYHFAAQVAVTSSVIDPVADFEVNARGTLNVLEAARRCGRNPFFFYTSTNKVYGSLRSVRVVAEGGHYRCCDEAFRGIDETEPLDFHSPYGCSKGTADQYVRDYARIYGLRTVVFRMSCIAGPRQLGTEDQGWVAHFLYSALSGRPITIYGDGFQVRDVLHVSDLVEAIHAARSHMAVTAGQIYNLGGGMTRAFSVVEMLQAIEKSTGKRVATRFDAVRPGDQPFYVSDTSRLEADSGWRARRNLTEILADIQAFWKERQMEIDAARRKSVSALGALEGVA